MAKTDEILIELRDLKGKLYGENGDKGDIPEIRDRLGTINGTILEHQKQIASNKERSENNEIRSANNVKRCEDVNNKIDTMLLKLVAVFVAIGVPIIVLILEKGTCG